MDQRTSHLNTSIYQAPDAAQIQSLFSELATNYDQANSWITMGLHLPWKKKLIQWSQLKASDRILDCATGTGDLAFLFENKLKSLGEAARKGRRSGGKPEATEAYMRVRRKEPQAQPTKPPTFTDSLATTPRPEQVVGIDFCPQMLEVARQRKQQNGASARFQCADVLALPFADQSFDVVSIGYGLRNVSSLEKALDEIARVLKPGGRLMILETGEVKNPLSKTGIRFYSKVVVPLLGGLITGHKASYEYLEASSARFPSLDDFRRLILSRGTYRKVDHRSLMLGASYLYRAERK